MDDQERLNKIYPPILYHYTSFEKFECILKYGTMRFKLSTQSNDLLDTRYILDLVKKLRFFNDKASSEQEILLKWLIGFFQRDEYKSSRNAFVSCFTGKPDSRLFWDAYTVNRPTLVKCELGKNKYCQNVSNTYNGLCIGFKRDRIIKLIEAKNGCDGFERAYLSPVWYSEEKQLAALDFFANTAWSAFEKSKANPDQSQNIIPTFVSGFQIDVGDYKGEPRLQQITLKKCFVDAMFSFVADMETMAPVFKHQFWDEEQEFRAVLCRHIAATGNNEIIQGTEDNRYIDIPISSDLIDHVILGPTFSESDAHILNSISDAKIPFSAMKVCSSQGAGIITMR